MSALENGRNERELATRHFERRETRRSLLRHIVGMAFMVLALVQLGCGGKRSLSGSDDPSSPAAPGGGAPPAATPQAARDGGVAGSDAHGKDVVDGGGARPIADASLNANGRDAGAGRAPETVLSISISPSDQTLVINTKVALTVTGMRADGSTIDLSPDVMFVSTNPAVANVVDGSASAVGVGTATITAVYGALTANAKITVNDKTLTSLVPSTNSIVGQRIGPYTRIRVLGVYDDMSQVDVTSQVMWTSSDNTVVWPPQDASSFIQLVGAGSATLTATFGGRSAVVTVMVSSSVPTLLGPSVVGAEPLMRPMETNQLQLAYVYSNGQVLFRPNATWVSSNAGVLSVSSSGFAEALATGTSTVSAAADGKVVASALITVKDATLQSIAIGPANLTVPFPAPLTVTATGLYSDGSTFDLSHLVNWESDPQLAFGDALSPSGVTVTATATVGTFHISATLGEISASALVTVPFGNPDSIAIQEPPSLPVGFTSYPVFAAAFYGDTSLDVTSLLTWSIDDPTIATMGAGGLLHTLKVGTTQIRATYPGYTIAPAPIAVTGASLLTIDLSPTGLIMFVGDSPQDYFATATYDNGQVFDVTSTAAWSTGNPQIASVSSAADMSGLVPVSPVSAGVTVVRATVAGVTGATIITVEARDQEP